MFSRTFLTGTVTGTVRVLYGYCGKPNRCIVHWSIRTWMLGVPLAQSKAGVSARSSICNGMSSIPPLSHSSMLSLMFLCPGSGCYFHFATCQCSRIVVSISTSPEDPFRQRVGWKLVVQSAPRHFCLQTSIVGANGEDVVIVAVRGSFWYQWVSSLPTSQCFRFLRNRNFMSHAIQQRPAKLNPGSCPPFHPPNLILKVCAPFLSIQY